MFGYDLEAYLVWVVNKYWTALTVLLIANGIYFTLRTRFIQYRRLGYLLFSPLKYLLAGSDGKRGIGSLYTFFTTLGTMIGSGNILGVSVAIFLGGPGAIFWMWLIATINMSVSISECTLGQYYKQRSVMESDKYIGGPAYYIKFGLQKRWMAVIFALAICANMIVFNGLQSYFLAGYVHRGFGLEHSLTGTLLAILFTLVVLGGVRSIAKAASYMVPIGTGFYILLATFILISSYDKIPSAFALIFKMGLGIEQAAGGLAGYTFARVVNMGARRGLYSNEAGLGTMPCIAAASNARHPTQEGFVQTFCVFIDTIVVCTCTALIILTSGIDITVDPATSEFGSGGSLLIDEAIVTHLQAGNWPTYVMCAIMFFLVFTSLIGNYYIGETNQRFFKDNRLTQRAYQMIHIAIIFYFSISKASNVINITDLIMGIAATTNVLAIFFLSKQAIRIIHDYEKQLDDGVEIPEFRESYPLISDK